MTLLPSAATVPAHKNKGIREPPQHSTPRTPSPESSHLYYCNTVRLHLTEQK